MARTSRKSELLDHLTDAGGGSKAPMTYEALLANLPPDLRYHPGESAKEYRSRIAPYFTQMLVAKALQGDMKAMELGTSLLMKDMDNQVKLAQIVGPTGEVKRMIQGGAEELREMSGLMSVPSAAAGVAAGVRRASDLAGDL